MKKILTAVLSALALLTACKKEGEPAKPKPDGAPLIVALSFRSDTLHIQGRFGPPPTVLQRRVIINDETVPEEKIVEWKEEEIKVIVEKKEPAEKKIEVEVAQKRSNVKIITLPVETGRIVRIDYLQVAEPEGRLLIHGQFGADPGVGKRSITVEQVTTTLVRTPIHNVLAWTPNLIMCRIPNTGAGSHGKVIVRVENDSASRGLYQYNFILDYNRPQGGANGTLAEKIRFYIWLRGDGGGAPAWVQPLNLNTNLHDESKAEWWAGGEGSSSYNNADGCGNIFVQWQPVSGTEYVTDNKNIYPPTGWHSFVTHRRDGFDLRIAFDAATVIPSKVTFTPCIGPPTIQNRKESIYFDEFEADTIRLRVAQEHISAGEMRRSGLSSSAGLAWDAAVFPQHLMTATLKWNRVTGKLD